MDFFSLWIIPPAIGAVIGYFTNWLAIKMLFRPHRQYRLLGVGLPFTPGILPRERMRLAKSVGAIVAAEILTPSVFKRRFENPGLRASLEQGLDERLGVFFADRAADFVPLPGASGGLVGELAKEAWTKLVSSEAFKEALSAALRGALAASGGMRLGRILPAEKLREICALFLSGESADKLRQGLAARLMALYDAEYGDSDAAENAGDKAAKGGLTDVVGEAVGESTAQDESLLPPEVLEPIVAALAQALYRASLPALERFLKDAATKQNMEAEARDLVGRAIDRLNFVQRLIVSAAQYEKGLRQAIPGTIDDFVSTALRLLNDPQMPARAATAAVDAYRRASEKSFSHNLRRLLSRETALAVLDSSLEALSAHGPEAAARLAAFAAKNADLDLSRLFGILGLSVETIAFRASETFSRILAGGDGASRHVIARALHDFLESLSAGLGEQSLGESLGIGQASRLRLAKDLSARILDFLANEASLLAAGLDVSQIVAERINELDMEEVERIILEVVSKELNWITLLGGLLGGVIGVAQSLLMYFRG